MRVPLARAGLQNVARAPFSGAHNLFTLMMSTTKSDEIRAYVFDNYIVPARTQKSTTVTIVAGDVARALNVTAMAVCPALMAVKFEQECGIRLLKTRPVGHGEAVTFTFRI